MIKNNPTLNILLKPQVQIAARMQALKVKECIQQRKDETRRKILGVFLEHLRQEVFLLKTLCGGHG